MKPHWSQGLVIAAAFFTLASCTGKKFWEATGRGLSEFKTDSAACIQDAIAKDAAAIGPAAEAAGIQSAGKERIYRRCMAARGWTRVSSFAPTDLQFRGPEEDPEDFLTPPDPLSERGVSAQTSEPGRIRRP